MQKIFWCILAYSILPTIVSAQVSDEDLQEALEKRVTVYTQRNGATVFVKHCRSSANGCDERLHRFAQWILEAAKKYALDPVLLAAIAVHESGLNPFAEGSAKEMGIYQLHPKGVGKNIEFVKSERYRKVCHGKAGACQREVIEAAAKLMGNAIRVCGGEKKALGFYNTGKCDGKIGYVGRVLRQKRVLMEYLTKS